MTRSKNTYPELVAQKLLDEMGVSYSTHVAELPGTPDIVIQDLKLVIFVHGCFWHKHSCQKLSKEDQEIINKDYQIIKKTTEKGYKPIILWECDLLSRQIQTKDKLRFLIKKLKNHRSLLTFE